MIQFDSYVSDGLVQPPTLGTFQGDLLKLREGKWSAWIPPSSENEVFPEQTEQ